MDLVRRSGWPLGSGERSTTVELPVPQGEQQHVGRPDRTAGGQQRDRLVLLAGDYLLDQAHRADQALVVVIIAASRMEAGRPQREMRWVRCGLAAISPISSTSSKARHGAVPGGESVGQRNLRGNRGRDSDDDHPAGFAARGTAPRRYRHGPRLDSWLRSVHDNLSSLRDAIPVGASPASAPESPWPPSPCSHQTSYAKHSPAKRSPL